MAEADLVLLGYGVDDSLQITVDAQRLLARTGTTYTLGLPPNLARFLAAQRVATIDLADRFLPGRPFEDVYLDVADALLRRAAEERPVILLTYGNPMFLNSLARFLYLQAKERNLSIDVRPAVSQFDQIVSDLGLDVGATGIQLFDARRLLGRQQQVNPRVPLLLLQLAGLGTSVVPVPENPSDGADFDGLAAYLRQTYPAEHMVTLLNLPAGTQPANRTTVPLGRFAELVPQVINTSHLFVDAIRRPRQAGKE